MTDEIIKLGISEREKWRRMISELRELGVLKEHESGGLIYDRPCTPGEKLLWRIYEWADAMANLRIGLHVER